MRKNIIVDKSKCIGCGLCIKDCPTNTLELKEKKAGKRKGKYCIECSHCIAVCPKGAISFEGIELPSEYKSDEINIDTDRLMGFIKMKRSVRNYKKKPVEQEKIDKILEVGRISPTGSNAQLLKFTVINDEEKMKQFKEFTMIELTKSDANMRGRYKGRFTRMEKAYNEKGFDGLFYDAPLFISIHADVNKSGSAPIDVGIAAAQMTLVAETLGLGSCYIGFVAMAAESCPKVKEFLKVPKEETILTNLIIGYPNVKYKRAVVRKDLEVNYI